MVLGRYIVTLNKKFLSVKEFKRCITTIKKIDKLLIANRGEIACRVIKTAKNLGIQTVAVYSDADRKAMHVLMADEAYNIGPASSLESYLRSDKIIEVAKRSNSKAIHPGYGFLSENTEFADQCQSENIIFVGPPASAIRDMGIKSTSKAIMTEAGVPVVKGYHGDDQSTDRLIAEARKIGFPIMIKAVRGGGGKGMRIVNSESEFMESLESAKTESYKFFNDKNVLLEQYIDRPRHVEVQVFADQYGNGVYLFERDCSVQRRHQKIIEEAPAPGISEELRRELGEAAVRAAKSVNYVGAGTVEFILNRLNHSFHFMEMNTRLQVEHPITEMITGTDLVEWQLRIAAGEKLPVTQDQIILNGHAFEGRIYAENPSDNFMPRPGPLTYLSTPRPSKNVRIETGVRQGDEVSIYYDPMIAKLVVWGANRSEALAKFTEMLTEYNIAGVDTNINFLLDLCRHSEFIDGKVHTGFIDDHKDSLFPKRKPNNILISKLALAVLLHEKYTEQKRAVNENQSNNPFVIETGFRVNHSLVRSLKYFFNGDLIEIKIRYITPESYQISIDNGNTWMSVSGILENKFGIYELKYQCDGFISSCKYTVIDDSICIFDKDGKWEFIKEKPNYLDKLITGSDTSNTNIAVSPMPGLIEKINVKPGDEVKVGDSLFVLIAMKMEYAVKANRNGIIANVNHKVGDNVEKNAVIVEFETDEEDLKEKIKA
ncbi:methylcrotonoyl-CoA carboxylase subunit alpha, mitochondrial [Chrysoperla carnea]|uniref:methylcrotonoyl-CoA carboxylase subunit alpha, mitochondrial n=1 Tax=Chrysoperla carnea TaxID=189513 RepID=UPI001D08CCCB|nr:methylcrotonoyl-CoA carboxylase subunit alpha, mitochondrial [Chrysoperla carnea]